MKRLDIPLCLVVLLICSAALAAGDDDLRDLRVGMSISEIPADEYVGLACAALPDHPLADWGEYRQCPADTAQLRAVSFRFDDARNPLAQVNDTYEGTKVAGHPVLLQLLIDDHGIVGALRIDTDPQARLFWRKKAYLLADQVKIRYGEQGWKCGDAEPTDGETPVGGVFIKAHCEKIATRSQLLLDQLVYRRPGQAMNEFVNETHLEIRRVTGGS
jgi:hypothetical protein